MQHIGTPELMVLLMVAIILFGPKSFRQIAQELTDALSNFRGGPGSPSHPVPGNDSRLLNRKKARSADGPDHGQR
jgi:Sec-independent protein translocase protein TatA